ncbi:MAG: response regulator [Actinomycetes bacterium]
MAGGSSILLVEDDPSLRMLCRVSLELEHFEVRDAATLADARAAIEDDRPALVFLDLHLGADESDGLLDSLHDGGIPVVVVSGEPDNGQFAGRADDVIEKPFLPDDLIAAARRFVRANVSHP